MSIDTFEIGAIPAAWTRRHLLDLESLSAEEINVILDTAVMLKEATGGCLQKLPLLTGRTIANLFFENSTRTRTSFSALACSRREGWQPALIRKMGAGWAVTPSPQATPATTEVERNRDVEPEIAACRLPL